MPLDLTDAEKAAAAGLALLFLSGRASGSEPPDDDNGDGDTGDGLPVQGSRDVGEARITLSIDDVAVDSAGTVTATVSVDNTTISGDGIGVSYELSVTTEGQTQTADAVVFPDETNTDTYTFDTSLGENDTPTVVATIPFDGLDVPELTVTYPDDGTNGDGGNGGNGDDPTNGDGGNGDGGNGDGDNGDGGDDPVPNDEPQAHFTYALVDGTLYLDATRSMDFDGFVDSYEWEVSGGGGFHTDTGPTSVIDPAPAGTYDVTLTVTDDDGASEFVSKSFTYGGRESQEWVVDPFDPRPAYEHTLLLFPIEHAVHSESSCPVTVRTNDALNVSGDTDREIVDGNPQESFNALSDPPYQVHYAGDLLHLSWENVPLGAVLDGERVDPYELTEGGPRRRWIGGGDEVVEITLYETEALYQVAGKAPARTLAEHVGTSLERHGVSHDILYDLPIIEAPVDRTTCHHGWSNHGDSQCRDRGCDDIECCSYEGLMPSTYEWWRQHLNFRSEGFSDQHFNVTGGTEHMLGDVFSQRRDSNMILVDSNGGGCAAVGGNIGVVGMRNVSQELPYDEGPHAGPPYTHLYAGMHEIGHNFGYSHPAGECGDRAGGEAWLDRSSGYNRTPCVSGHDCTNNCGFYIPDPGDWPRIDWLHYSECSVETVFRDSWSSGEAGNVASEAIRAEPVQGPNCDVCQPLAGEDERLSGCGCEREY